MTKGTRKGIAAVAVVLGAAAASSVAAVPQASGSGEAVVTIDIEQLRFQPDTIRVAPGTTVRWVNRDAVPHTVVSGTVRSTRRTTEKNPSGRFESENLEKSDAFEFSVKEKGAIPYYCGIHPFMTGVILVE